MEIDLLAIQASTKAFNTSISQFRNTAERSETLLEEIEKVYAAFKNAKDTSLERNLIEHVVPFIDTLQFSQDLIKTKIKEIEAIFITIRTNIMKNLVAIKDATGISITGDRASEADEIHVISAEAASEAEIAHWESKQTVISSQNVCKCIVYKSSQWPLYIIPENVAVTFSSCVDRVAETMANIETIGQEIENKNIPIHLLICGEHYGLGKTQLAKDICNRYIDNKIVQFIGWVTATDESQLVSSYRKIAQSIKSFNINFCENTDISTLGKIDLLFEVNNWLEKLNLPWILIIDDVNSTNLISQIVYPKITTDVQGIIIITSRLSIKSLGSHLTSAKVHTVEVVQMGDVRVDDAVLTTKSIFHWDGVNPEDETITDVFNQRVLNVCKCLNYNPWAFHHAVRALYEYYLAIESSSANKETSKESKSSPRKGWSLSLGLFSRSKSGNGITASPLNVNIAVISEYMGRYLLWANEFQEPSMSLFPHNAHTAGICSSFFTLQAAITKQLGIKLWPFNRAIEMLAFLCPSSISLSMITNWFRIPYTPLVVKVQKKWRLARTISNSSQNGYTTVKKLPNYDEAEFELLIESVCPVMTLSGPRFSWRVYQTYSAIREVHESLCKSYSSDMVNVTFPPAVLPYSVSEVDMEESISQRRAELANYFIALTSSECWGHICSNPLVIALCGYDERSIDINYLPGAASEMQLKSTDGFDMERSDDDRPNDIQDLTLKLLEPLFSLNLATMSSVPYFLEMKEKDNDYAVSTYPNEPMCSVSGGFQEAARSWLRAEGKYDDVVRDLMRFFFCVFKRALAKYKKQQVSSAKTEKSIGKKSNISGRYACEQLISHILSLLTVTSSRSIDCFELCEMAFYFTSKENMLEEALICATRGLELTKHIPSTHVAANIADATWHSHLADICSRLNRKDEARNLYEHSLSIFRNACGNDSLSTIAVMEKLAALLFDQCRYRQSIRLYEESLSIHRKSDANAPNYHLRITAAISKLVQVIAIDAPDNNAINRCLELKQEELHILKRLHGDCSVEVGQCLNLIGEIEHKAGRSALAKQYFEDSLDTFVRCVGSSSKEVVSPMYNLAMEMHRTKKYDDARILYEKVLEIDRKGKRGSHDIEYLTNIASVHDGLGIMLSEQKKYESAMSHLEDACKIYRKIYGDKNRDVAMSLKNMAFAWLKMGNQQVAITLYEEAIEILKNLNSRSDEEVLASTLNSLGELRVESKEYEKARALFMECLHIRVNLFGENHVDTVATLKNIGSVSYACENFEEAREFCLNALKLQKVLYGSESEEIAASCGQLAEICRCLGRGNEAKNLFKEAVRIYKSVYVNDHPTIALHLNNWASMLFSLGQYDECESIYNESLKMLISLNGGSKETTTIAASLHNLAELQRKLNKNAKALSLHEQSLAIRLKLLGPSHIEVASSLARISELMFLQNDKNAALESCGASLGIRMKAYGLEHEHVIESLQMMAKLKVAQGNLSDAEKFLRDALAAKENMDRKAYFTKVRLNGNNNEQKEKSSLEVTIVASLETATIIDFLCSVIPDDKEHLNEKIELYEKCLRIKRSLLGEEDNEVANTLTALANLSCLKGNFQDAIEINKIAKSIRANINGENHPLTCVSISNIANCLKRLGKLDEACDLFEQCVLNARVFNRSNDHPSVGIAIDNVASVLQLLEQYEQAAIFNEQALNIHTNAYGEANALVAATHYRIGHIHRMQSNYSKAKLHYMKALNVQRSVLGFNNEAVAASMEALAVSLELSGSTEEAKIIQNESSEVHIKVYRNGSEDRVQERLDLGTNLRSRAKYLESTHQFERALKIAIAMHGENHIDVVRALEGLAWLKDAKGVSTQARKYHQRALSIRAIISNDNKEDDRSDMRMMSNLALLLSEKTE